MEPWTWHGDSSISVQDSSWAAGASCDTSILPGPLPTCRSPHRHCFLAIEMKVVCLQGPQRASLQARSRHLHVPHLRHGPLPRLAAANETHEVEEQQEEELLYDDRSLRLFLDCADVAEWRKWGSTGLFYGFTTNPTILKRDNVNCTLPSLRALATEAFRNGAEELQLQAWGRTAKEMAAVGQELAAIDERIVVKLPITFEGIQAAKALLESNIPFTMTGIYAAHQVVTAIACGAVYAAPYLGRMNDAGKDGMEEILTMQDILSSDAGEESGLRLLVASIRSAQEISDLAAEGCNTFTISPAVATLLFEEPLTNQAAEVFQGHAEDGGAI